MSEQATYLCHDLLAGKHFSIRVENGRIVARDGIVTKVQDLPTIIPSFVDMQVNGFQGLDLNEGVLELETVEALSDALCCVGVRAYLPTLITASEADLCQRLQAIRKGAEILPKSKELIAGIHIEGPAISHKDGPRGAHPKEHIRPASIAEFERWQDAAGGFIKLITLAPETEDAACFIEYVTSRGVIVALGHCDADEADISRAVDAGARMSTHLGNGIAINLPRHPNAIWAQLAECRLTASFIADRHHLPKSALKSMLRAKGLELSILVSDSVKFAGLPAGRYSAGIGGEVEVSEGGRISIADTPYLAGSGACLLDVVVNFSKFTKMPLQDAVVMACNNPAKLLGLKNDLAVGAPANFILLNHNNTSHQTSVRDIIFQGRSVLQ